MSTHSTAAHSTTNSTTNTNPTDLTYTAASFYRLNPSHSPDESQAEEVSLSPSDKEFLLQFINARYLKPAYMEDVNLQFCENSSLLLRDFLRADLAAAISRGGIEVDALQRVGGGGPQKDYTVGISNPNQVMT